MNKKDIIQIGIIGILIIVLVSLVFRRLGKKKDVAPLLSQAESSQGKRTSGQKDNDQGLYAQLEEETRNLEPKRNPFTKQHLASSSGPYLNGIVWDPENPRAIIDDRIVENGAKIKGYTVVDIRKDMVILNDDAKNIEIQLKLFK